MPEASSDAAILIATSFQALERAKDDDPNTSLTNCTITILFAGFYIEATLNYIFEYLDLETKLKKFPRPKSNPGLHHKLTWFYNEFISETKYSNWRDLDKYKAWDSVKKEFPGIEDIKEFRNDISHGKINDSAKSLEKTIKLRQQAKRIVNQLYAITESKGSPVDRDATYWKALKNEGYSFETTPMSTESSS